VVRAESIIFHFIFALKGMKMSARLPNLAKPSHNVFTPTQINFSLPDTCYISSSTFVSVMRSCKLNHFVVNTIKH